MNNCTFHAASNKVFCRDSPGIEAKDVASSNARRSKLLSGSVSCESPISILQKKAIGELYPVVPVSSCAFNVCRSYTHFNFFPYKLPLNRNVTRFACTALICKTNICVKTIQWHKLWYNFPVVTQSCSGERAVSFKRVSLLESL